MPFIGYRAKKFNVPSQTFYGDESNTLSGSSTPSTPASGLAEVWFDSSLKKWRIIYDNGVIESLGVGLSGAVAHKDTHKSGGSDPFVKTDVLNTASRYLETISDPASDAGAFWLVDGGLDIKYWDDQGTPVKQTLERRSLKGVANGYCDLDASALIPNSRLPSSVVRTDVANTFTQEQKISEDATPLMTLYRPNNTAHTVNGFEFHLNNSTPAEYTSAIIESKAAVVTAGAENTYLNLRTRQAGASIATFQVFGDGRIVFGTNLRGSFNDTGLTQQRTFTLPDATTLLAGISAANDYGDFDNSFKDNRVRIWNPADTFRYTVIASAITGNRNTTLPLLTEDDQLTFDNHPTTVTNKTIKSLDNSLKIVYQNILKGRWGHFTATGSNDDGVFNSSSENGTGTAGIDADGFFRTIDSAATTGSVAGRRRNDFWCRRDSNVYFCAIFATTVNTVSRFYCGLCSQTALLGNNDTPLDNLSGIMIGFRSTDTNWQIIRNDGDATSDYVDTGVTKDTGLHWMDIQASANGFTVRFGNKSGGAYVTQFTPAEYTTEIPAATTSLSYQITLITNENVAKTLKIYGIQGYVD